MFKDGRKFRFSVGWLMRFIAARYDNGRMHLWSEAEEKKKEEESKREKKREPDTRLIISIFHSDALDEKGRWATSGDYKRPLLFHAPTPHAGRSAFHFFSSLFLVLLFFFAAIATTAATVNLYLMVLSRVRTGGNLLQRFARGSIYQGPGRRAASAR